jgi:predicted outer membrane repeat protein
MSGDDRYGTIVFGGGDTSRAVNPTGTGELSGMKYRITMEGPGGTVDSGLLAGNGSGINYTVKVLPGSWNILVKAYNSDNVLRAHSRFTVTVSGGGTAAPNYTLTPIVGVNTWEQLDGALGNNGSYAYLHGYLTNVDTVYIMENLNAASQITIPNDGKALTLAAEGVKIINGGSWLGGVLFSVGGSLTLGDEFGTLIVEGRSSGYSLISVSGGTLTMQGNTTLRNNIISSGDGGAVSVSSGTFNMTGGTIGPNNSAPQGGGVNILSNGTFNMGGGSISGNTATTRGGGVYVTNISTAVFKMAGGTISGNSAPSLSGASLYKGTNGKATYGDGTTYIVGSSTSSGFADNPITGHP